MKNLKKFEISKNKQKNVKGGNMQPDPVDKCCNYTSSGFCSLWVPHNVRCPF